MSLYRLPFDDDSDWQLWNSELGRSRRRARSGSGIRLRFCPRRQPRWHRRRQPEHPRRAGRHGHRGEIGPALQHLEDPGNKLMLWRAGRRQLRPHPPRGRVHRRLLSPDQRARCSFRRGPVQLLQGHVIGLCGNTGNSSTAHLHFDVRTFWNSPSDMEHHHSDYVRRQEPF